MRKFDLTPTMWVEDMDTGRIGNPVLSYRTKNRSTVFVKEQGTEELFVANLKSLTPAPYLESVVITYEIIPAHTVINQHQRPWYSDSFDIPEQYQFYLLWPYDEKQPKNGYAVDNFCDWLMDNNYYRSFDRGHMGWRSVRFSGYVKSLSMYFDDFVNLIHCQALEAGEI